MMTDAAPLPDPPAPLVAAGVDLRDFPFTPVYRARLFASAFHAQATDAAWRAGMTLWLKCWDQVPAGSLPADDAALCRLAELGRDLGRWRRLREQALCGWRRCADGRLYHPRVAEAVTDAWTRKQAQRQRTAAARAARHPAAPPAGPPSVTEPVAEPVTDPVTESVAGSKGQGQETAAQRVVAAFDQARVAAYGPGRGRAWPHATDLATAAAWLAAGAEAEALTALFHATHGRRAARGQRPIDVLSYFDQRVAGLIADAARPLCPETSHASTPRSAGPRSSRDRVDAQLRSNREAVLSALAGELAPQRSGA
jgi:hypothetical protein